MATQEVHYKVIGMTCASCAASIETMLHALDGVEKAEVRFASQQVIVHHDPEKAPYTLLQATLAPAGYFLLSDATEALHLQKKLIRRIGYAVLLTGALAAWGMTMHLVTLPAPWVHALSWAYFFVSTPIIIGVGRLFWRPALEQLRHRQASMDTLITLGLLGSWGLSLFSLWHGHGGHTDAAAEILFFVLLGRLLEEKARTQAQSVLENLSALARPTARCWDAQTNEVAEVPTPHLQPGMHVLVHAGEVIPLDGLIVEGSGHVREALLTGEPLPVFREKGQRVFAGTELLNGKLLIEVEKPATETFLARLILQVQAAQSTKARAQRLADRVAAIFVPLVLGLSLVALGLALWRGQGWLEGWLRLLSVLVISCPCALGLATPLAVQMAIGRSARRQILLREVAPLERLPEATTWAFDKTGTLTYGQADVLEETWWQPELQPVIAFLLARSEHPLAQAAARHLRSTTSPEPLTIQHEVTFPGKGVLYQTALGRLYVGHPEWLRTKVLDLPKPTHTALAIVLENEPVAYFTFQDKPRLALKPFLQNLQKAGKKVVLLSGDPSKAPQEAAQALGIPEARSALSPADKAQWIAEAQARGEVVAFVGDGLNDLLALQKADIGIAVYRSAGAAVGSAAIALLSPTETALPYLYDLSRRLRRIIAQNLFWAFVYNVVAIPAAMGLLPGISLSPALSALLMSLSSLTVVLNSLRLRA